MAQKAYGTITITDTNDINRIYVEYCRSTSNQLSGTTVPDITRAWGETTPEWVDGQYIWQRTVVEKSGTLEKSYGEPVCLTGAQGETGEQGPQGNTGAAGRSLTSTVTQYTTATNSATITQSNMGNYTWSNNVPTYNSNTPAYWVRITNTYSNPSSTQYIFYKDNGITDAVKTSNDANTTASTANTKADNAVSTANSANTTANQTQTNLNNYITSNDAALLALQTKTKHFWRNLTARTNGSGGWTKPNYPVGTYAASGISGTTFDEEDSSTYGYNTLYANGIKLRYNAIDLGELTGSSLTFYVPTKNNNNQVIQGPTGMTLTSEGLKIYNPSSSNNVALMQLNGQNIEFLNLNGDVQAKFGQYGAYIPTLESQEISIGDLENNKYWRLDNSFTDYIDREYITLIGVDNSSNEGEGNTFIQPSNTGFWRIGRNRIHTGWYNPLASSDVTKINYKKFNSTYFDSGIKAPSSLTDKTFYIRHSTSSNVNTQSANTDTNWTYKFYVDGNGDVHAQNFYAGDTLIGGNDSAAGKLTVGAGSTTHPVYFRSDTGHVGEVAETTYALNAAGAKGVDTNFNNTSSTNLPTTAAVVSYVTSRGYITSYTDNKVQTSQANTTKIYLAGTSVAQTNTGTLNFDSNVYLTTTAGTLHATTFEGNLSGTASRATADSDGNTIKTTYLKLSGGQVTGPVTFGSSVSADELTAGDLVVNGAASFTNGLYGDLIGNADTATKVGKSLKIQLNGGTTEGTNQFTFDGSAAKTVNITKSSIGLGNVENKSSATIRGELTSSNVTTALGFTPYNATNPNGYTTNTGTVTSVRVQASSPLQSSTSTAQSETLNTTISFTNQNVNTVLAGPASGSAAAAPTFRKLVAADIPDISGTYYLASNPNGYTTNTGTVTSVQVQASSPLTSTANTASSTTLSTTIKFSNQNKNLVLAGPTSGNAAAPTFRSLVADDIPSISKSKISDFPTSLKNPNAITLNLFNETAARSGSTAQNTPTSFVTYDGSTANQSFSAAGRNAITSIGISGDTLSWIRADGSSGSSTVTITASVASGATVLTDTNGNTISTTGNTTPVWFEGGIPKDVEGIAFSLLPTGTGASNVAVGNHTHGNITNGGDITTTATIASGDRLVINDESESKINNSSITFGTSTTTFLTNKGTWATPVGTTYTFDGTYNASSNKAATVSTVTNAINALDGGTIGTPSASKTITAISQTNGNISVTFGDISITKSQISDFPTSMTPAAHTHDDRYYTETEIDNRFKKYIPFSHYSNTNGNNSGKYYKISINSYTGWMLNFTVKMYHAYKAFDLQISGYNYGSNHWYSPAAVILGASVTNTVEVNFGYDSDYHLWIAIPAEQYTGIGVTGFTNGYQQVDSWEDLFTITMVDGLPSTKQSTVTAYRPWYRNETVSNATSATSAGKWTTARNFTIKDSDSTNSGTAASVDGSGAVTLLLPSTIKASLTGNASTATKWASAQTVYVTLGTASTSTTIQGGSSSAQTIGVNGTLAIGNGGTGLTSNPSMLTNLGSTTAANVLQASPRPGITGTLGAANGGTGQTSLINAANSLLNALSTGSSTPVDNDYYISQYVGGGTTTTTYHRRPMSALWSYISGKISSSGTYVTIATDQTITANQKTFNGAIRWSSSTSTAKYGAMHYDSTLEALVFSFA